MMKIPLVLDSQKEGGWTITSPLVPELVTEIADHIENGSTRFEFDEPDVKAIREGIGFSQ